jgi:hypothetical protein
MILSPQFPSLRMHVIPEESGCLWVRLDGAKRSLKEAEVGLATIPSELEQDIVEWCSVIRQGNWDSFGLEAEGFLRLGTSRIAALANWLPIGWTVILDPNDFPRDFANRVMCGKVIKFTGDI